LLGRHLCPRGQAAMAPIRRHAQAKSFRLRYSVPLTSADTATDGAMRRPAGLTRCGDSERLLLELPALCAAVPRRPADGAAAAVAVPAAASDYSDAVRSATTAAVATAAAPARKPGEERGPLSQGYVGGMPFVVVSGIVREFPQIVNAALCGRSDTRRQSHLARRPRSVIT